MHTPIKYGTQTVVEQSGNITTIQEETFNDFQLAKRVVVYTESIRVRDNKGILAEFLKLLDRQTTGEIERIGLRVLPDVTTGGIRVEKSWVVPDLQ